MITGRQICDARKLIGWGQEDLSRQAAIPIVLLVDAESVDGAACLSDANEAAIRKACEIVGIEFGVKGSTPFSVRWRKGFF